MYLDFVLFLSVQLTQLVKIRCSYLILDIIIEFGLFKGQGIFLRSSIYDFIGI